MSVTVGRWSRLLAIALALAASMLSAGSAQATTRSFQATDRHGHVLVYKVRGVNPARVHSARLRGGGRSRVVNTRAARAAARSGTLRIRMSRAWLRSYLRARRAARVSLRGLWRALSRRRPRLLITTAPPPAPAPSPVPAGTSHGATLTTTTADSQSMQLRFAVPERAERVRILRDGRLVDELPAGAGSTYRDYLLWESTSYSYELVALDGLGARVASATASATTPARGGAFERLYADSSFWNQPIPQGQAFEPGSAAMVQQSLAAHASRSNFANSDAWGIGLAYANPQSRRYAIGCSRYGCSVPVAGRIPRYAAASSGSDGKLSVIDPAAGRELDMWIARYDSGSDSWSAASRFSTDPFGWGALCGLGERCNGPNAAGTAGMGGVVRPEEIAQGHIDHALAISTPYTRRGYIACPATHTDGKYDDPEALPEGARIQLDPSFDVDATSWPRWKQVIAKALQRYGAYVEDTGGTVAISGESNRNRGYDAWARAGTPATRPSIADLPWSLLRVLRLERC